MNRRRNGCQTVEARACGVDFDLPLREWDRERWNVKDVKRYSKRKHVYSCRRIWFCRSRRVASRAKYSFVSLVFTWSSHTHTKKDRRRNVGREQKENDKTHTKEWILMMSRMILFQNEKDVEEQTTCAKWISNTVLSQATRSPRREKSKRTKSKQNKENGNVGALRSQHTG